MASPNPEKRRLKLQPPVLKAEKDYAFYIVPPVVVALVFAFCAYVPREMLRFNRKHAPKPVVEEQVRVDMPDPNASLPGYDIPEGCVNLLQGAQKVSASSDDAATPARNAVNGSCEDTAEVAVARAAQGSVAWWQVEMEAGKPAQQVIVYGGGSKSPAGKLEGGFCVEVLYDGGEKQTRDFCQDGFALEGYESLKLDRALGVRRVRVIALRPDTPLVLREVQLIGEAE